MIGKDGWKRKMIGWRKSAKSIIRNYPLLKRKELALHTMPVTPTYSAMPGRHSASRTTETAAIKTLPPDEQRQYDAVNNAISTTLRYRNGDLRLKIIDLVFWLNTHTLEGAAQVCNVSYDTAAGWHNDFITLVDAFYRII